MHIYLNKCIYYHANSWQWSTVLCIPQGIPQWITMQCNKSDTIMKSLKLSLKLRATWVVFVAIFSG